MSGAGSRWLAGSLQSPKTQHPELVEGCEFTETRRLSRILRQAQDANVVFVKRLCNNPVVAWLAS